MSATTTTITLAEYLDRTEGKTVIAAYSMRTKSKPVRQFTAGISRNEMPRWSLELAGEVKDGHWHWTGDSLPVQHWKLLWMVVGPAK